MEEDLPTGDDIVTSLDARRTVRVGYVGSGFPLVYSNIADALAGIHKEMWKMALQGYEIAWEKRAVYGGYDPDENGYFDGMIGELQNGTLDIGLQDFSYRTTRMEVLYYTLPVEEMEENFYERGQVFLKPAIVVIPFTPDFTAILTSLLLAMKLTEALMHTVASRWRDRNGAISASCRSLSLLGALIHRLAIILVLIIYNAAFVGLSTTPAVETERDLSSVLPLLRNGEMTLVVNYEGTIKDTMKHELFGGHPAPGKYFVIPDMEYKQKVLCHDPKAIYFGRFYSITHNDPQKHYKQQCAFKRIHSSNLPAGSELEQRRIGKKRLSTFYMSRRTVSRRVRERFSHVQLTLFQRDTIDYFWWRRYTHRPRFSSEKSPIYAYQPIGFAALETIFIVFASILLFCIAVFILEFVHGRFRPTTTFPFVRRFFRLLIKLT